MRQSPLPSPLVEWADSILKEKPIEDKLDLENPQELTRLYQDQTRMALKRNR